MSNREIIETILSMYKPNELIQSEELFKKLTSEYIPHMTKSSYQKTLDRLCAKGHLSKLSKSLYCRPKKSKYGVIPPTEREIIQEFTANETGMVVGYSMYNALKLTTQIAKTTEVYSSKLSQQTKTVGNIRIKQHQLNYSGPVIQTVQMLEVLQHYYEIQDLNQKQFLLLCKQFVNQYHENSFAYVESKLRYRKSTIAFLKEILDYYHIHHTLNRYLSDLSTYNHPKMEDIYAATSVSR